MAWGWGTWRLTQDAQDTVEGVRLRIVQPNIAQDAKWRAENAAAIFDTLASLSVSPTPEAPNGIADVTHVIWPESAVPVYVAENEGALARLDELLPDGTVLIMGALRRDPMCSTPRAGRKSTTAFSPSTALPNLSDNMINGGSFPAASFFPSNRSWRRLAFARSSPCREVSRQDRDRSRLPIPGAPLAGMLDLL